jgi:transcriptional regulator GlxA family with amidase domain
VWRSQDGAVAERSVLVVVHEGAVLLDVAGPVEVFHSVRRVGRPGYDIRIASVDGGPLHTSTGPRISADVALADVTEPVDTLVVVGTVAQSGGRHLDPAVVGEVRRLAELSRRVTSVCNGAFVLAAAGLLDGARATTHWSACRELARGYPAVRVEPDAIFVRDGRITTSAGVTAGIDLALALVEEDHGADVVRQVARRLVVFVQRPGGQSQFSAWAAAPVSRHEPLREVVRAVVLDPGGDHSVPAMAARATMSVRHFSRLFAHEIGMPPAQYVERARVDAARGRLESGDDSQDAIARRCGFGTAETMRRAFLRVLGVPPGAYRDRFRTTGLAGGGALAAQAAG